MVWNMTAYPLRQRIDLCSCMQHIPPLKFWNQWIHFWGARDWRLRASSLTYSFTLTKKNHVKLVVLTVPIRTQFYVVFFLLHPFLLWEKKFDFFFVDNDSVGKERRLGTRYLRGKKRQRIIGNKIKNHFVRLHEKRYSISISVINYACSAKTNARTRVRILMVNKQRYLASAEFTA